MKKIVSNNAILAFILLFSFCGNLFSAIDISNMHIDGEANICEGESIDLVLRDYNSDYPLQFQFSINGLIVRDFSHDSRLNYLPTGTGEMLVEILIREDVTYYELNTSTTVTVHSPISFNPDFSITTVCSPATVDLTFTTNFRIDYYDSNFIPVVNPSEISLSGVYHLVQVDNFGCRDTATVVVTINPSPSFVPNFSEVTGCVSASIIQPEESGFSFQYFEQDRVSLLANPSAVLISGTYYISKTNDITGCVSDTMPIVVNINPIPIFSPTTPATACSPNTVSIEQAPESGFEFFYFEDSAGTVPLLNYTEIDVSGTFFISKRDTETGCVSDIMPIVVNINPTPIFSPTTPAATCSPNTVSIEQAPELGFEFFYFEDVAGTVPLLNYTEIDVSGTFFISKRNTETGCMSDIMPVFVTIHQTPVANAGSNITACERTTVVLGGSAFQTGVSYSWTPLLNFVDSPTIPNPTVIADRLVPFYVLTVQLDGTACFSTDTVFINSLRIPEVFSLSGGGFYCTGDFPSTTFVELSNSETSAIYTLYRGTTLVSQRAGTGDAIRWENLHAGDYTVIARLPEGCEVNMFGMISIEEMSRPTASITTSHPILCPGDYADISIRFSGTPPFTVTYENLGIPTTVTTNELVYTFNVQPLVTSTWRIISVADFFCETIYQIAQRPSATITVGADIDPRITTLVPDNTICSGSPITLTPVTLNPHLIYRWSTGDNTQVITVNPTQQTTFSVEIMDSLGCARTGSITINTLPLPEIDFIGPDVSAGICINIDPIELIGIPTGGVFSGPNVVGNTYFPANIISGADFITYSFIDQYGCRNEITRYFNIVNPLTEVDWYVVGVDFGLPVTPMADYQLCRFPNDVITLQGVPRTNVNTEWTISGVAGNPATIVRGADGMAQIINAIPGTYHVTFTYIDNNGCFGSQMKVINISSDFPDVLDMGSIIIPDVICSRDTSILVKAEIIGGTFSASDPRLIISQNESTGELWINPSLVEAGTYSIMYYKIDNRGCVHRIFRNFTIRSPININPLTIPNRYCVTDEPVMFEFTSSQPVTGFVYIVRNDVDTVLNQTPSTATLTFNPAWGAGNYQIIFNYFDGFCQNTYRFNITVFDSPVINMNLPRRDYCFGEVITFNATPAGGQYSSSNNNVGLTLNRFDTRLSGTGVFTIFYHHVDTNSCPAIDSVQIFVRGQEDGDMSILNLEEVYCENSGSFIITGFPQTGGIPSFRETEFLTDLGNGTALIDLSRTNHNSVNDVTFYLTEYFTNFYGEQDYCISSITRSFRVLNESANFVGFNDGDTICGNLESILLVGNRQVNSWFEINNVVTGTEIYNLPNGRALLFPNQLIEGWYTITFFSEHYEDGEVFCSTQSSKSFYLLPIAPYEPRLVCLENNNAFVIDNTQAGVIYELWLNGQLFETQTGNGGSIFFSPINREALVVFYARRDMCRVEHPTRFHLTPLSVNIDTNEITCFGSNDGQLTAIVSGGISPVIVSWSSLSETNFSSDLIASNLPPNTYTVLVTDSIGCTATTYITLQEPLPLEVNLHSQSGIICNNSTDAFAQVIATGGTLPHFFQWLDYEDNIVGNTASASNLRAGVYRVFVSDRNNCRTNMSVVIQEFSAIEVDVVRIQHVEIFSQATGEIDINVSGSLPPYSFEWSGLGIDPANRNNQNQVGLIAGRYFLTVTDANNCQKEIFVDINQPERLTVEAAIQNISCFGANDGQIDITVSGGLAPYSFYWTRNGVFFSDTEDLTNLEPGIYSVVITDSAGDTFSQNYLIETPEALTIIARGNTNLSILCYGAATATIEIEARGGTPAFTYEWLGIDIPESDRNNPLVENLPAGNYRIIVTDANNCSATMDFEATQPEELRIITSVVTPPTCFNGRDASIDITVSGGIVPYSYFWEGENVIPSNEDQINIGFGIYRVMVTDANNCNVRQEFSINNPAELRISLSSVQNICIGSEVELHFGMNENRNWHIDYTDGVNIFTVNSPIANAFVSHSITENTTFSILQAFDQNGCFATIENGSTSVLVHEYPDVTLLQNHFEVCLGEEVFVPISLSGQAPWRVVFSDGNSIFEHSNIQLGIDSLFILPSTSTTYRLISVSTNYCTTNKSDEINVVVHPLSQLSVSSDLTTICEGTSTLIELNLQGEAPWRVFYTEGNEERDILVPSSPHFLEVNLNTTTQFRFHTVESAFGCVNQVSANITINVLPFPEEITGIVGPSEVCAETQATFFVPAVLNATQYVWTVPSGVNILNGINTNQILVEFTANAQSGTFSVYARNNCGNSETVEFFVTVTGIPEDAGSIILPAALCQGEQNFFISTTAIANASEYVWTLPHGFIITQGEGTRDILVSLQENAVSGVISVYGRNACGRGASSQITAHIRTLPNVEAGPDTYTDCNNFITLNAQPVVLPYQGTWRTIQGQGIFQNIHDPNTLVTDLIQGENLFVWEVSDGICTRSDTVMITNLSPDIAMPEITDNFILCEETLTLRANNPIHGVGRWDLVGGSATIEDPNSNITTATNFGYGHNVLRWTVSNGTCSNFALVNIYYYSTRNNLFPEITDTTFVPEYRLIALPIPQHMTGEWTVIAGTGNIVDPSNNASWVHNLSSGLNTFRWTVSNNYCTSYTEVKVHYLADPIASFIVDTLVSCTPFTPQITNTTIGMADFLWDFGDGTTSTAFNPVHTYEEPGTYTITLTAIGERRTTIYRQEILVRQGPRIDINVLSEVIYMPNANLVVLNRTTGASSYLWDFGTGSTSTERNPTYTYRETGIFDIKLIATDRYNCSDSILIRNAVEVKSGGFIVFPNAFVPNKDFSNGGIFCLITRNHDVFYPIWNDVDENSYTLEIFNRWGEKIFVSNNINIGWDGYVNGQLSPMGVYIFRATGRFNSGESFVRRGEVTLIQ